jgi:hypothetical protein
MLVLIVFHLAAFCDIQELYRHSSTVSFQVNIKTLEKKRCCFAYRLALPIFTNHCKKILIPPEIFETLIDSSCHQKMAKYFSQNTTGIIDLSKTEMRETKKFYFLYT